jgi:hypothetical protein
MSATEVTPSPLEALLVEHARLMARELQKVADDAPHGRVLAAVETAAVPAARALARTAVQALLQQQAEPAEKKGPRAAPAPTAAPPAGSRGAPPAAS